MVAKQAEMSQQFFHSSGMVAFSNDVLLTQKCMKKNPMREALRSKQVLVWYSDKNQRLDNNRFAERWIDSKVI